MTCYKNIQINTSIEEDSQTIGTVYEVIKN